MINLKKRLNCYTLRYLLIGITSLWLTNNSFAQNPELTQLLSQQKYQEAISLSLVEAKQCNNCPSSLELIQRTFLSIIHNERTDIQPLLDQLLSTATTPTILQLRQQVMLNQQVSAQLIKSRWTKILRKIEHIAQTEKDLGLEALANLSYGQLCYYTYKMDSIVYFYDRAIQLCEKAFEPNSLKRIRYYQNYINFQTGHSQDFEKALTFCFKSVEILNNNPTDELIKTSSQETYKQIARIYLIKGDVDRAIDYIQQALQVEIVNPIQKISSLQLLYKCYVQAGNLKEATKLLQEIDQLIEALKARELFGYEKSYAHSLYIDHSLNIIKDKYSSPEKVSKTVDAMLSLGSIPVENQIALASFCIANDDSIQAFHVLADLQVMLKNANATNMPRMASAALKFGDFWLKYGQPQKALDKYQEAITTLMSGAKLEEGQDIIASTDDHPTLLKILIQKDKAYQQLPNQDLQQQLVRYQNLKLAIEVIDQQRQDYSTKGSKVLLLNNVPKVYNEAVDLLHNIYQQDPDAEWLKEAFLLSEKSKAMLLMDALKEDKAHHFGNVPDSLRRQEQSLQKDISFYQAELFKAKQLADSNKIAQSQQYIFEKRKTLETLKKQLEQDYPKYYQLKHNEQIASIATIQKGFNAPSQALVEYMVSDNFVHIFLITAKNISWHKFSKQQLKEPLEQLYQSLTNPSLIQKKPKKAYKDFIKNAHQLYQLLIAPITEELSTQKIKELVVVPDGNLTYIPFDVLLTNQAPQDGSYRDLAYLLRTYSISYNYSATLWLECLEKAKQGSYNTKLLGFAPNYDKTLSSEQRSKSIQSIRKNLEDLNGTQKELAFLNDNFEGSFYKKNTANEQIFKQNAHNYGLIHLAMHGLIDVEQPNYSALVFAENTDTLNDNFLYAYELPSLMLNAQLVVLSACQTGYGKYQNGEGVMSLGRGFIYAGTPSLVMTLWAINDQASSKIMELFYANLKKGQPKREALQQAKLMYLEESKGLAAHPAFWSPFILHGDNTALNFPTGFAWYYWVLGLLVLATIAVLTLRKLKK